MSKKKLILIVDDDESLRKMLKVRLSFTQYKVETAGSGEEAFEFINKNKPDLIVLDIMMPMRSGISIYKEIISHPSCHIPVILISGMAGASDFMDTGFRKLANDDSIPLPEGFIEKPVAIDTLIQKINDLIGPVHL